MREVQVKGRDLAIAPFAVGNFFGLFLVNEMVGLMRDHGIFQHIVLDGDGAMGSRFVVDDDFDIFKMVACGDDARADEPERQALFGTVAARMSTQ